MSQPVRDPTASDPPPDDLPPSDELQDIQPVLEQKADSIWTRVDQARDDLCDALHRACGAEGFDALVIKSDPFVYPAWVKLECWTPKDRKKGHKVTEREHALVTIEAKEFHRYNLEYKVEVYGRGWMKTYPRLREFGPKNAGELAHFLLSHSRRPRFAKQLRQKPSQIWKPRNKVDVLRTDWLKVALAALAALGLFAISMRVASLGLLFLVGAGGAFVRLRRRRAVVLTSEQPEAEPRLLRLVDSWQAVIPRLGNDAQLLRERFLTVLKKPPMTGFQFRIERIWYWGLDGKVEREQIVLILGRALVFCQIYEYDQELYVGWGSHLNNRQWFERTVGTGIHKETGVFTQVNTLRPGFQPLTGSDLNDLNCLSEWAHSKLVQLVQHLMEERGIDEEIDFKIIRGERQGLTDTEEPRAGEARQPRRKLLDAE